jgi:membrane-associated phospholipid phosphatase
LWTTAVVVSIVYLGEHYVVDALAAIVYVAAATIIVETVSRLRARRAERAAAATPATPSA